MHTKNLPEHIYCKKVKLIIFVTHGLNGKSNLLYELYIQLLKHLDKDFYLYIPVLPNNGNEDMDISIHILQNQLSLLMQKYKDAQICLIGLSLGGLLNSFIIPEDRKVYFIAIASPLLGTLGATWFQKYNKLWIYNKKLLHQMNYLNPKIIQNYEKYKKQKNIKYLFIACINDHLVLPFHSSVPNLENSDIIFCNYSSHIGIQIYVAEECALWLKNNYIK